MSGCSGSRPRSSPTSSPSTEVLVERRGKRPGQWLGKSPWLQSVFFEDSGSGRAAIGDLVTVTLVAAGPNSMAGERVAALAA